MTNEIVLRLAVRQDVDILVRFNRAMARETEDKELVEDVLRSGVSALLDNPASGFYIVAESPGEVVGSMMVTPEWSDWHNGSYWWIQSVYIVPSHRRKGIYRQLYGFVKNRADEDRNVCGFRLYVEKNNVPAQRTYEACCMKETNYKMYEEREAKLGEMDK